MSKSAVIAVIVLMTTVLVGLVSIQVYWIKNAIALKEQQFDQGVAEALNAVNRKLEKKDAMTFFFDEFFTVGAFDQSMDRKLRKMQNQINNSQGIDVDVMLAQLDKEFQAVQELMWKQNDPMLPSMKVDFDTVITIDCSDEGIFKSRIKVQIDDSVHRVEVKACSKDQLLRSVDDQVRKLKHRQHIVSDILFQFFSEDRSIQQRIDQEELENLLTAELGQQGINAPYEYVVTNGYGQPIAKSEAFNPAFTNFSRTQLFPNDLFTDTPQLIVQFPSKRSYILGSLGVMSFSSIGLILLVSLCFAYTIHVILRQKRLSEMKTDFINNMTHELKTPVSTISLASEMLRDKNVVADRGRVQKYADVIYDENKRLGGQVEKVLQMAVLDRGDFDLKIQKVDFHDLVHNAINKMSLQIESNNVQLETVFNAKNTSVDVDESHMTNIILNLLDNAIKYSKERPAITIKTWNSNTGLFFSVSDKGIGMSKDAQKRVFEKFYRVPTGNRHDVKGFGLGLTYVHAMVEAHGGNIKLHSELNKGTTFEIFIPQSKK